MRTSILLILAAISIGVTSCNTAIGFGRDLRSVGQGMENVAHGNDFNGNPMQRRKAPPTPPPPPAPPTP